MGVVLDGKQFARTVRQGLKERIARIRQQPGRQDWQPGLATILIGEDPASRTYISTKEKVCREVGIAPFDHRLPTAASADEVVTLIGRLNARPDVHGILLQLPLPDHLEPASLIEAIRPDKDVDGLHPVNQGRLVLGQDGLRPCTPLGVMYLIDQSGMAIEGKRAVVVGRSNLVGKPIALLLLQRNATVTTCHSQTTNLADHIRQADLVVTATGQIGAIRGDWIKEGAGVIDVGISRSPDGSLKGDVEFAIAKDRAAYISPVPGGVGPLTVAMLLANTVQTAAKQTNIRM
jgi:methylenetetrahydrofolate dehydrogenase (NADP+)/methenyltetrahydrofolate cyclohydrolase